MGDSFGHCFRVTTFGESHGGAIGGVVEGVPPGLQLDLPAIQAELDRRRPGQSKLTSSRQERDRLRLLSGLDERGRSLGTAIGFTLPNRDADPSAYSELRDTYRPSHADYTYEARYGLRAWAGGGRASARETACRVVAGGIARQVLARLSEARVEVIAWVQAVAEIEARVRPQQLLREQVEATAVRCPDPEAAKAMIERIRAVRAQGDSVGGQLGCVARGLPAGLGAPVFDKLDADLAKALLSIPACKGMEVGSGFAGTRMRGRQHNDAFVPGPPGEGPRTRSNHSGGIQGGISNGMPILLMAAFKPVATIFQAQDSVDRQGRPVQVRPRGRHDPCVLPRAVPIVEAMVCCVLADHWLRWRAQVGEPPSWPFSAEEEPR